MEWIWWALAVFLLLGGVSLRKKLAGIPMLVPPDQPPEGEFVFLTARDIELTDASRSAAIAYAQANHIDLLHLIPRDQPALASLEFAQMTDGPVSENRLKSGPMSTSAVMVRATVLDRAGCEVEIEMQPAALYRLAKSLKRCSRRSGIAIDPWLKASSHNASGNADLHQAKFNLLGKVLLKIRMAILLVLVIGPFLAPAAGFAALLCYHLQPLLVFLGGALRPRGLGWVTLFRIPLDAINGIRLLSSRPDTQREQAAALRPVYEKLLAQGTKGFFLPRRDDCPICGSRSFRGEVRTTDLMQGKPGRFNLDRCSQCRTVFQNPRLSVDGLSFYYRDAYDGLGKDLWDALFSACQPAYKGRVRITEGLVKPSLWLDVGGGHGHFCCAAQDLLPETEFHGIDIGDSLAEAEKIGWVHRGIQGFLPDLASSLEGRYDVVSLFHCLEHVTDVRRELTAARTVLRPGGCLVIEVPNPECRIRHWLGRFWTCWMQPQHLHMLPLPTLKKVMRETGFEAAREETIEANIALDFTFALSLLFEWLAPRPDMPWRRKSSSLDRIRRSVVVSLWVPMALVTLFIDGWILLLTPLRRGGGNIYRVVAQRID